MSAIGTRAAYARHAGVSKPYVTELGQRGRLVEVEVDGKKLIDFEASDELRHGSTHLGQRGGDNARRLPGVTVRIPTAAPDTAAERVGSIFRQAQAQERAYLAKFAELKFKQASGDLVEHAHVVRATFEAARELRDGLVVAGRRIATEVAALNDATACEAVIEREHRQLLEQLAQSLREQLRASVMAAAQ